MTKKEVQTIKELEEKMWKEYSDAEANQYSTKEYIARCRSQWVGVWTVMKMLHVEERR